MDCLERAWLFDAAIGAGRLGPVGQPVRGQAETEADAIEFVGVS